MNQKEFIQELKGYLIGLNEEDVKEILEDYEEHFKIGKKNKRKESEIAKSLGDPKDIAREVRKELKTKEISFREESIGFWIKTKKLAKKVWKNIAKEIPKIINRIKKLFKGVGKNKNKKKVSKNKKRNSLKIVLLILLNLFFVLWFWIGLFAGIISLIVSSWSIVFSGAVSIIGILFGLSMPFSTLINSLLMSGLFASIGITCLGLIFSILTWKLGKGFFWLTGKYLKWNNKIFGGKK